MAFKRRTKVKPDFSLASMTDLVFLLLIFFMITSTLVSPNAIKVSLPKATNQIPTANKAVQVTVKEDLTYYVNTTPTTPEMLENDLNAQLSATASTEPVVSVNCDKSVPVEHLVNVMKVCNKLKAKTVLATQAE